MNKKDVLAIINDEWKKGRLRVPENVFNRDMRAFGRDTGDFGGDGAHDDQVDAIAYAYGFDYSKIRLSRDELIRCTLLSVVQYEESISEAKSRCPLTSSLFRFRLPPSPGEFAKDAVDRGWLRIVKSQGRGYHAESTGLGRCIAELHRNTRPIADESWGWFIFPRENLRQIKAEVDEALLFWEQDFFFMDQTIQRWGLK